MRCFYNNDMYCSEYAPDRRGDYEYKPITPVPDSVNFRGVGRLILQHGEYGQGYPLITWVEADKDIQSGWVIGVEK